ncbi:MAG: hypothetical protein GF329_14790 [Candidatus Lokiarchaeota archaeon]|nr:hypothetical protein [Candidatus Lokiarchaeota archaeon]
MYKLSKRRILKILIGLFLAISLFSLIDINNDQHLYMNNDIKLSKLASTDPNNPILLNNSVLRTEYNFTYGSNYYYKTYLMSKSNYHLIYLSNTDGMDDFDLVLYSDSDYSDLIESSDSYGNIDWIVCRPTDSTTYYPRVHAFGSGDAIIESKSAIQGKFEFNYSTCSTLYENGDIFQFSFTGGVSYTINLSVPIGTNLDLYCYKLSKYGELPRNFREFDHSSSLNISGEDESIIISPEDSGIYAIIVMRKTGTSSGNLIVYPSVRVLYDDISLYGLFDNPDTYYNFSSDIEQSYDMYQLFWVSYINKFNDMDIYLYLDSDHTIFEGTSESEEMVDWLVYFSSSSAPVYPVAYTSGGPNIGYFSWESACYLEIGESHSEYLNINDSADIVQVYLTPRVSYTITLTVPTSCDFDLYVFKCDYSSSVKHDEHISESPDIGKDETITFRPDDWDNYTIVVIRKSGNGTSKIKITSNSMGVPGFEISSSLIGIMGIFIILTNFIKKSPSFLTKIKSLR